MQHWAFDLIGRPWSPSYTCWDLVREVFATRHNISMPALDISSNDNVRAITEAAHVSGWRRVEGEPHDGDIVLLTGLRGRHVGVLISSDGKLLLLHNSGRMTPRGPTGGVVAEALADVIRDGYGSPELWRYKP